MSENNVPSLVDQIAQLGQQFGLWAAVAASFAQNFYLQWKRNRNTGTLGRIEAQLQANGGSTVKDAINRVETKLDGLTREVTLLHSMQRMLADMDESFVTWVASPIGDFEFLSLGITKLTGRQVEALKGNNWLNMVHDKDRDRVEAKWREAVAHKRDLEVRFDIAGEDTVTPVAMRAYVSKTQAKVFTGWTGTIITQGEEV